MISQLVQKYAGVFHARHLVFVTVEKLQQVFIFRKINRVHRQIFWENKPVYFQDGLLSNRQRVLKPPNVGRQTRQRAGEGFLASGYVSKPKPKCCRCSLNQYRQGEIFTHE